MWREVVAALPASSSEPDAPHLDPGDSVPNEQPGSAPSKTLSDPATKPVDSPNRCDNSVLAHDNNGWGALDNAATARDPIGDLTGAAWAFRTAGSELYLPQLTVSPGQHWTFAARSQVLHASGTLQIAAQWYNSGGQFLGSEFGPVVRLAKTTDGAGAWTALTNVFTVPFGATNAHVLQIGTFGSTGDTGLRSSQCDFRLSSATPSVQAAVRYGWGEPIAGQSDEYNAGSVDLSKWGLFGASVGQRNGCAPGYRGHGQRCGAQTTQSGGYLHVTGTADGRTGGLYSRLPALRYARIEVRQRSVQLADNGGADYRTVPLLWPENDADYQRAEIDFAERELNSSEVHLYAHRGDGQAQCKTAIDPSAFHTYAIDWLPTTISWYVDGSLVCTVAARIAIFDRSNGGAQMDMFDPTGTLMRPARQDVDWVRTYRNGATELR